MEQNTSQYNIATASKETLKNMVLLHRNRCMYEIEQYHNYTFMNAVPPNKSQLKSNILTLFIQLKHPLLQEDKETHDRIVELKSSKDVDDFLIIFNLIDTYLWKKGLTRFEDGDNIPGW